MTSTAAPSPGTLRRIASGLVLLFVAVVPPLALGWLVLGSASFTLCLFGVMVGLLNTLIGGVRVGLTGAALFVLLAPVALTVGAEPVAGAALMAVVCLFVGGGALWRRYSGFFEIPLGMIYLMTLPETQTSEIAAKTGVLGLLVTAMLATGVSALWAVAGVRVLRADKDVPLSAKNPKRDTVAYTVIMTTLVSLSTLYVLTFALDTHGEWLVLTLFMVLQIGPGATTERAFHRVWGTIAGAMVAAALATVVTSQWLLLGLVVVALLGTLGRLGRGPYWLYTFFLTNVILLGTTPAAQAVTTSLERVGYTVAAAVLSLLAIGAYELFWRPTSPPRGNTTAGAPAPVS